MIDQTSSRIEQQQTALRRKQRRRYAFQRMLAATDRVLWRLEDLNRDGVKNVPPKVRAQLRDLVETMPLQVRESVSDSNHVQDTLDSLFEVQERLFKWRFPDWQDFDPEQDHEEFDFAG
jgi:hypothetical protein